MPFTYCGRTHICGRPNNEDSFAMVQVNDHLAAFAVADGLGGLPAGEVASRIAVSALMDAVRLHAPAGTACSPTQMKELLHAGFLAASRSIAEDCSRDPDHAGMATTLVAALICDDGTGIIAYAGDSRAYLAGDRLIQITKDHSLVQELVQRGIITKEAARVHPDKNIVSRVISQIPVQPDMAEFHLDNQTLLLCTDGLTDAIAEEEIFSAARAADVNTACSQLIEQAVQVKRDNTTIIVIRRA